MPFDNQMMVVIGIATILHYASFTRFHQPKSPVLKIITRCLDHQREVVLGLYFGADDNRMKILHDCPTDLSASNSPLQASANYSDDVH